MNDLRSRLGRGVTSLVTLVLVLPMLAAVLTVAPLSALADTVGTSGTAHLGPAKEVHGPPRTEKPPTPTPDQIAKAAAATEKSNGPYAPVPDDPNAKRLTTKPQAAPHDPTHFTPPTKQKASDLVAFQNNAFPAGGQRSTTDEPSVASAGAVVFWTGNWYAAISNDGGQTFTYIDPFSFFTPVDGGFCCDQEVIYSPSANIFIWELQYIADVNNKNTVRLAVATPAQALANTWFTYDLIPSMFGWNTTTQFDYPNVSLSNGNFYLSENIFINGASSSSNNTLMRFPLATLASHSAIAFNYFNGPVGLVPVQGATTTMYFADHASTTSLNLWSWPEANPSPTGPTVVSHSLYVTSTHSCVTPDTRDPCARDDTRVKTGWVANGIIGFMWDVGQGSGGLGTFTYPYVHVVRINAGTSTLIDEPVIYSGSTAYAFPGVGVNSRGAIGGSIMFGGGTLYPGSAIFVQDDFTVGAWEFQFTAFGTNSPSAVNRWGDYLIVRPADGNGTTWIGTSYTLQGPCSGGGVSCANVTPRYLRFGRQRDYPFGARESLIGIWRNGVFYLRNSLTTGAPDIVAGFGSSTDSPLMCDFDGNGSKTPTIFRNGVFYWSTSYNAATLDGSAGFGTTGDVPICGDWNGTGYDKVGIFRNGVFILSYTALATGVFNTPAASVIVGFGTTGDIPIVGDWNNTGSTKIGIFRNGVFYESYSNTSPAVNQVVGFGTTGDRPVTGDWNRDGVTTYGILRNGAFYLGDNNLVPGANYVIGFGTTGDTPLMWR